MERSDHFSASFDRSIVKTEYDYSIAVRIYMSFDLYTYSLCTSQNNSILAKPFFTVISFVRV